MCRTCNSIKSRMFYMCRPYVPHVQNERSTCAARVKLNKVACVLQVQTVRPTWAERVKLYKVAHGRHVKNVRSTCPERVKLNKVANVPHVQNRRSTYAEQVKLSSERVTASSRARAPCAERTSYMCESSACSEIFVASARAQDETLPD